ncbi:MAG TPA: hypothetical protein VL854_10250 [Nitrososphaeraceae archaeon]|nr:hypothetical protein [Nitrososphaeraceae archaeon]
MKPEIPTTQSSFIRERAVVLLTILLNIWESAINHSTSYLSFGANPDII